MTDPKLAVATPHGRHYAHPNRKRVVPSITNIKDKKAIDGLKFWAAREAATYAAENLDNLSGLSIDDRISLIKGAPFKSTSKKAQSARVGDIVHYWIETRIKGEEVDPSVYTDKNGNEKPAPRTAQNMWRSFLAVEEKYHPEWIETEFTVWSDEYGYAGTGDWIAKIGDTVVLGDTKTGERIYADMRYQLSAIAHADFILEDDGTERPLPKFERFAILHLRPTYGKLIQFNPDAVEHAFGAFLGLAAVFADDIKYEDNTILFAPKIEWRVRGN